MTQNSLLAISLRSRSIRIGVLPLFVTLQCLDVLTTLIFLNRGVEEGNPLVKWTLLYLHSPWLGLALTKLIAAVIGWSCHLSGRLRLLRRANAGYSLVVGWNLLAIATTLFVS